MTARKHTLTPKQARFVDEYLIDLNATQAAIRAGYSHRRADQQGLENLRKPEIAHAIAQRMKARAEGVQVHSAEVLRELKSLAMYDPADIASAKVNGPADIARLPEATRRAIIGWGWDKHGNFVLKLSPKTPSLELLGRHLGMWKDRLEVSGSVKVEVYLPDNGRGAGDRERDG